MLGDTMKVTKAGETSITIAGHIFYADEDGAIDVPDGISRYAFPLGFVLWKKTDPKPPVIELPIPTPVSKQTTVVKTEGSK
jgi:hypothetical protein